MHNKCSEGRAVSWTNSILCCFSESEPAACSQPKLRHTRPRISKVPSLFKKEKKKSAAKCRDTLQVSKIASVRGSAHTDDPGGGPRGGASLISSHGRGGGWLLIVLAYWKWLWMTARLCVKS